MGGGGGEVLEEEVSVRGGEFCLFLFLLIFWGKVNVFMVDSVEFRGGYFVFCFGWLFDLGFV